jgi:hypothetical protein
MNLFLLLVFFFFFGCQLVIARNLSSCSYICTIYVTGTCSFRTARLQSRRQRTPAEYSRYGRSTRSRKPTYLGQLIVIVIHETAEPAGLLVVSFTSRFHPARPSSLPLLDLFDAHDAFHPWLTPPSKSTTPAATAPPPPALIPAVLITCPVIIPPLEETGTHLRQRLLHRTMTCPGKPSSCGILSPPGCVTAT